MAYENMRVETDSDGIATITWDMPNRSMNVLSRSSMEDFHRALEQVLADDSVKGIIVTSGKDAFMAGADLSELGSGAFSGAGAADGDDPEAGLRTQFETVFTLNKLIRRLETGGKPAVAAINGTALGGGFELCLGCHYRVAADNDKSQIGLPEAKVGVMPGGGGTQRVTRLIGVAAAGPLLLQGKSLRPNEAKEQGLIHDVVPAEELLSAAKRWLLNEGQAEDAAKAPWDRDKFKIPGGGPYHPAGIMNFMVGNAMIRKESYLNYPAQANIMKAVYEGLQVPFDAAIRIESRYFLDLLRRPESRNMIRTLFLSMQELGKGARRPQGVDKQEVTKVGVLGAGLMGAGIAYVSAYAGLEVVLLDVDQANAEKGKDYSTKILDKRVSRGRMTDEAKAEVLNRITPTTDYQALKGCDLIIEAVFEDRKIKAEVTARVEEVIGADTVFGSNTSTLPITGLAEASQRPEQFIGIHFFSPVEKMPLVELILGEKTNDLALARALDYVRKIKKTPIVVNDSRGFYTSRCFSTYVREGLSAVAEGVNPALVENAGRMAGMPMGPMEVADSVGLDTGLKIRRATEAELGADFQPTPDGALMEWIVEKEGRVGRKAGKGFYAYGEDGKPAGIWPNVYEYTARAAEQPTADELKIRFLTIQALETARCFEEGVLTDVRDADVGSILGWGFAPYTGGTLSYIDTMGAKAFVEQCKTLEAKHGARFAPSKLLLEMAEKNERFYDRFAPAGSEAAAA